MIVCCGEALVDVLDGDEARSVPGGGPMNAAVAAARLGAPVAFVGRVSTDAAGDLIWRHLQRSGVELRACERGDEPTAKAIIQLSPRPSFRFEGDNTADTALGAVDSAALGDGPHILHGGTLGMFRGRTAEVLAGLAARHDGLVSLDPNVRPAIIDDRDRWDHFHQRWLSACDLYRASDEDLAWIWPRREAGDCAAELLAGRITTVMVTRGGQGVTVYTDEGELEVAASSIDAINTADTVGAGDSFVGSVLASLWDRLGGDRSALVSLSLVDWRGIAERAAVAAAITCSRPGADPPFAHELETNVEQPATGGR
ncbi:PfkB family carbohydrate kinase [Candidatus Poriferisodalis sp.]|uniref:PfkB family carbohydrate kinase n=1 Tax=Candidatus Poriferisodalis sp. TaxID=3101277 RepID=UPI003B025BBC